MFKLRQRSCLLLTMVLVIVPCIVIILIMGPELSTEQSLSQRLAESHMRIQYLESMYRARQEDVVVLSHYLSQLQNSSGTPLLPILNGLSLPHININNSVYGPILMATSAPASTVSLAPLASAAASTSLAASSSSSSSSSSAISVAAAAAAASSSLALSSMGPINNLLENLSPEARQLLKNAPHSRTTNRIITSSPMRLPSAYDYLPHLIDDPASLRPAFLQSKGRSDVSIVLGIPTVKRPKQSYLLGTLHNLIENMDEEERNETLIIVYIGETDVEAVQFIAKEIMATFEEYIGCGLIDIIAPAPTYYPDFDKLRITLNDSLVRVKWRSKQNLDFAYLMAYAQSKGTFYVQLEDDILARKNYISTMKKFAIAMSAAQKPWFIIEFCQLGFIGKLFKSAELPYLITYFQMFFNDQPVDWLLVYFVETKVCRTDKDQKHCNVEMGKTWLHFRPSLFQHIGTSSSLKGKVQKLKDKQFGWVAPRSRDAGVAVVKSPSKKYVRKRAYRPETFDSYRSTAVWRSSSTFSSHIYDAIFFAATTQLFFIHHLLRTT